MENGNQPPATPQSSSDDKTPPATTDTNNGNDGKGSPNKPEVSPQEKAYREKQSRSDRATHERDELQEQVDALTEFVSEQYRDKTIDAFVKDNADKYPLVSADDLREFAGSPNELEAVATRLQKKYEDIKQEALANVREVPSEELTEAEKATAREKLRDSNDPNKFEKFLRFASKRK